MGGLVPEKIVNKIDSRFAFCVKLVTPLLPIPKRSPTNSWGIEPKCNTERMLLYKLREAKRVLSFLWKTTTQYTIHIQNVAFKTKMWNVEVESLGRIFEIQHSPFNLYIPHLSTNARDKLQCQHWHSREQFKKIWEEIK